jgi:hypothetical protein
MVGRPMTESSNSLQLQVGSLYMPDARYQLHPALATQLLQVVGWHGTIHTSWAPAAVATVYRVVRDPGQFAGCWGRFICWRGGGLPYV